MKTFNSSVIISFSIFLSICSCKTALLPVNDIKFVNNKFKANVFYDSILCVDGLAPINDKKVLAVNEWTPKGDSIGVFVAQRGKVFKLNDAFSTIGKPFVSPDNIVICKDGTVFVSDGQSNTVYRISKKGGTPISFVTASSTGSKEFNPYGLAIAPSQFNGPNVKSGDLIIADNGLGRKKAVWAVNTSTGEAKVIAKGNEIFIDGPLLVDFSSDGKLYVSENNDSGKSRIINLSASGEAKTVIDSYPYRGSLAVHPKSDDIYFQMIKGEIHRIPKDGGKPSLFASNIGEFQSMVFNKKGTILFLGYRTKHQIIQIISNQENWKNP